MKQKPIKSFVAFVVLKDKSQCDSNKHLCVGGRDSLDEALLKLFHEFQVSLQKTWKKFWATSLMLTGEKIRYKMSLNFHFNVFVKKEWKDFPIKYGFFSFSLSLELKIVGWKVYVEARNLKFKSLPLFSAFLAYFHLSASLTPSDCVAFFLVVEEKAIKLRIYGYLWMLSDNRQASSERVGDKAKQDERWNLNKNMFKAICGW